MYKEYEVCFFFYGCELEEAFSYQKNLPDLIFYTSFKKRLKEVVS